MTEYDKGGWRTLHTLELMVNYEDTDKMVPFHSLHRLYILYLISNLRNVTLFQELSEKIRQESKRFLRSSISVHSRFSDDRTTPKSSLLPE